MSRPAVFFMGGVWGKEGPYTCHIIGSFGIFRIIRFRTSWDGGAFYTWRTRIKFKWNVIED